MAKIWKATYKATVDGQEQLVGFHYQFDGDTGSDEPDASSVADKIDAHLTTAFQALVISGNPVDSLTVKEEIAPGSGAVPDQFEKVLALSGTMSGAGAGSATFEMCALMHRKTGAAVRGAKSWTFLPSTTKGSAISSGQWNTGSGDYLAWQAFAALCDDALNYAGPIPGVQGNLNPVAYSRTRRQRSLTPYTFLVTSCAIDTHVRWLRSRGKGS